MCVCGGGRRRNEPGPAVGEKKRARARTREGILPKVGGGRLERGSASRERAARLPPPWRPSPHPSGPKPLSFPPSCPWSGGALALFCRAISSSLTRRQAFPEWSSCVRFLRSFLSSLPRALCLSLRGSWARCLSLRGFRRLIPLLPEGVPPRSSRGQPGQKHGNV